MLFVRFRIFLFFAFVAIPAHAALVTIKKERNLQYMMSPETLVNGLVEMMPRLWRYRLWRYRLVAASAFLWAGLECLSICTLGGKTRGSNKEASAR